MVRVEKGRGMMNVHSGEEGERRGRRARNKFLFDNVK
jgi:hypothetical protein